MITNQDLENRRGELLRCDQEAQLDGFKVRDALLVIEALRAARRALDSLDWCDCGCGNGGLHEYHCNHAIWARGMGLNPFEEEQGPGQIVKPETGLDGRQPPWEAIG